jgi:NADPH-dependent 2,4-dienoyl-CoA reductase/sulfur reductase-like enzyme/nitrite reductase/ring-hydroxylating ferredoxin subunit
MKAWTSLGKLDALPDGQPLIKEVKRKKFLVVRRGIQVFVCGNKCPHYGSSLGEGVLKDHIIACPSHSARFDVRNGQMISPPALDDIPCYEVKIEDGEVLIGSIVEEEPKKPSVRRGETIVLLGAGAAGNIAAETLRKEGFSGRLVMITREPDLPYDRPELSKGFLSGEAEPEWIPLRSEEFYRDRQIEVLTRHTVTAVEASTRMGFDSLLIAAGGVPRRLSLPGEELAGIFTLRSFTDAKKILEAVEKSERVVIMGAGFIGLEIASSIRKRGLEVHVVAPEELPMAGLFGERIGRRLKMLHEEAGVTFHLGTTAVRFEGNGALRAVVLSDGSRLDTTVAVVAVGIRPALSFLDGSPLVKGGAIAVNDRLESGAPGIFAAGDVASVPNRFFGGQYRIEHWIAAEQQGRHAARSMLGAGDTFAEIPFFWTYQHDISFKSVGYLGAYDSMVERGDVSQGNFLVGFYREGKLRAAAGAGMSREVIALGIIIAEGRKLSEDQLKDPGFDLVTHGAP